MPVLSNPRHERFAQELAKGKSAGQAYAEAGYKPCDQNASRLIRNDKVQARKAELQDRAAVQVSVTREWVLERLIENANRAMQAVEVVVNGVPTGEYRYEGNVANRALELVGKELSMFIDRKEVGKPGEFDRMTEDELRTHLAREAEALRARIAAPQGPRDKAEFN